jgi:hypothetical protein
MISVKFNTIKNIIIEANRSTSEAFIGAVSLISKACASPLASKINIKDPPPIPLDASPTTPKQRDAATAASTA